MVSSSAGGRLQSPDVQEDFSTNVVFFYFLLSDRLGARPNARPRTQSRIESRLQAKDVKRVQLFTPGFMMTRDDRRALSDKHVTSIR